jgi:hypothetical protein
LQNGLFNQTIQAGYIVIVAAVNSIIAVAFKLILAMYTKEPERTRTFVIYGCRYCNCIEYRFGFISIFVWTASVIIQL